MFCFFIFLIIWWWTKQVGRNIPPSVEISGEWKSRQSHSTTHWIKYEIKSQMQTLLISVLLLNISVYSGSKRWQPNTTLTKPLFHDIASWTSLASWSRRNKVGYHYNMTRSISSPGRYSPTAKTKAPIHKFCKRMFDVWGHLWFSVFEKKICIMAYLRPIADEQENIQR